MAASSVMRLSEKPPRAPVASLTARMTFLGTQLLTNPPTSSFVSWVCGPFAQSTTKEKDMGRDSDIDSEDGFLFRVQGHSGGKRAGAVVVGLISDTPHQGHHGRLRRRRLRLAGAGDLRPGRAGLRDGLCAGGHRARPRSPDEAQHGPDGHGREGRGARAVQDRPQGRRGRLLPGRHHGLARRDADPRGRRRGGLLRRGHRGHGLRAAEVPGAAPLRRDRRLDPARALGQGPRGAPEAARPHLRRRRPRLHCDERGSFHKASHEQARERTIAFFREHLG